MIPSFEDSELAVDRDWCVVEDRFELAKNRHYESILALGTGYLTTRANIEEGFDDDNQAVEYDRFPANVTLEVIPTSKSRWGTFMPVLRGRHPFWRTGLINLPYYLGLVIAADGEKLDLEKSEITAYRRWLNLKTATLYRTLTWKTRAGGVLELLFRRFMNPAHRFACVQDCRIRVVSGDANITVISFVDNDVRSNGFDMYSKRAVGDNDDVVYSDVTTNMKNRVITATHMENGRTRDFEVLRENRRIATRSAFKLGPNEEAFVRKVSTVMADAYGDKKKLIEAAVETIRKAGGEDAHRSHVDVWAQYWEASDVRIEARETDVNSQLAVRTAIYHLLRAKGKDEDRGMICPKGTTTEVYIGAIFWDLEVFILPFFIYTQPEMARTVPMFRYRNLQAARRLAAEAGYPGARYPWMSDSAGEEVCPLWQYADHEVHITADVVIGLWHYYCNSGDKDFLFDHGAEIIMETARYWSHRAEKIPGREGYHIYGVMGPDEYKPLTNNNAYTNHAARFNLELACRVMEMLRKEAPGKYRKLAEKISLKKDEAQRFAEVARGIPVLSDPSRGIVWQCEDFDTAFATLDIQGMWKDKTKLFGTYISQEKRYRSKCLKQSDVIALMVVFSAAYTRKQKEASFDYYDQYNIHDSSNSMCHHQMAAANLGRADTAYEAWKKSGDIDFGRYPRSADGLHCANVGGMWQEIVFGFCGLVNAMNAETLAINPCLPEPFDRVSFKLCWRQTWIQVSVTKRQVEVENLSDRDLSFTVRGTPHTAKAKGSMAAAY